MRSSDSPVNPSDSSHQSPLPRTGPIGQQEVENLGDKILDPEWLLSQSKEDLAMLVLQLARALDQGISRATHNVQDVRHSIPFDLLSDTAALLRAEEMRFVHLPLMSQKTNEEIEETRWQIILVSADPRHTPFGLYVEDDVVIGRHDENAAADLDLTAYDGAELGVSRHHALLRPTESGLQLFDLGSTNGTFCNGQRLKLGTPVALTNNDVVSFGKLHLKLKVVQASIRAGW